jgi:hypothetical protein
MPRVDFENLSEKETARIYIAGTVAEAKEIETLLSGRGIDYSIELEEFIRPVFNLMGSTYVGATFYVRSGQAEFCRTLLKEKGFAPGILEDS